MFMNNNINNLKLSNPRRKHQNHWMAKYLEKTHLYTSIKEKNDKKYILTSIVLPRQHWNCLLLKSLVFHDLWSNQVWMFSFRLIYTAWKSNIPLNVQFNKSTFRSNMNSCSDAVIFNIKPFEKLSFKMNNVCRRPDMEERLVSSFSIKVVSGTRVVSFTVLFRGISECHQVDVSDIITSSGSFQIREIDSVVKLKCCSHLKNSHNHRCQVWNWVVRGSIQVKRLACDIKYICLFSWAFLSLKIIRALYLPVCPNGFEGLLSGMTSVRLPSLSVNENDSR